MAAGCQRFFQKGGVIMTTNAAAASKIVSGFAHSISPKRLLQMAIIGLSAMSLAGCETSSSVIGDAGSQVQTLAPAPQPVAQTRLALAPVIGAPQNMATILTSQLTAGLERQKVVIVKNPSERVDYTLRGYVVAAKEKTATKVSYIWDVTDPSGKRVHRITGEEIVPGAAGKDAWTSVSNAVMQTVSDKTTSSFGTWLATVPPPAAPAGGPTPAATPMASAGGSQGLVQPASVTGPVAATKLASAVGMPASKTMIASPKVTGAPGDGNGALSSAMKRELSGQGVEITEATVGTYRVMADVKVKPKPDGNEAVSIDWIVNDPAGNRIATVTQNNDVPKGHLSGAWGQNADDAAKGASVQIKQVIADHSSGKAIKSSASQTANAQ
jgi:hypothetical protein